LPRYCLAARARLTFPFTCGRGFWVHPPDNRRSAHVQRYSPVRRGHPGTHEGPGSLAQGAGRGAPAAFCRRWSRKRASCWPCCWPIVRRAMRRTGHGRWLFRPLAGPGLPRHRPQNWSPSEPDPAKVELAGTAWTPRGVFDVVELRQEDGVAGLDSLSGLSFCFIDAGPECARSLLKRPWRPCPVAGSSLWARP
jgi:hypothetical protein